MEENNRGNTQQNIQNGQSVQGQQNSPQGASFGTQNTGGKVIGNDTAAVGSGGVVSLKGGQTQREINEQRKIEELKSRAVKLERKLTPREKELERMHKEAIKPSTFVPQQSGKGKTSAPGHTLGGYNGPTKDWQTVHNQVSTGQKEQALAVPKVDPKRQEELVENLINPIEKVKTTKQPIVKQEVIKPVVPKPTIKKKVVKQAKKEEKNISLGSSKESQIKKIEEQEPGRRMVISPAGQISYVDNQKTENNVTRNKEQIDTNKGTTKNDNPKSNTSSNIVNLKSEEKSTTGKDADVASAITKSKNITKTPSVPKKPETPWEEKKVDLKDLSQEKRIDMQATPSMASVNFNMDNDFNREMVEWFDKYNELPVNIKLGLGSSEVRQKIKELATKNNLMKEGPLGEISRIIRDVYVELIKAEDIKKRLGTILKLGESSIASVIKEIGNIVGTVKEVGNKKSNEYFDKLSLREALEKYPNIATEEITAGRITDKQSSKYVDSTVQNWMNDYINQMGSSKHTNLERGKYLNDSSNTKNLDKDDKKIIEKLTKSYDEDTRLIVDKEEGVILWNMHDDESRLGINSDKNKRVINKFKIEEAQTADVDADKPAGNLATKKSSPKINTSKPESNLENNPGNSIMKGSLEVGAKPVIKKIKSSENKKNKPEDELLDLSSEIPVG